MGTIDRRRGEVAPPPLSGDEAELVRTAQRCVMAFLDHSRAPAIALVDETKADRPTPAVKVPPKALRLIAEVLGAMAEGKPFMMVPTEHEMTTMEAAQFLNVSRPFVIKEVEAGRLPCVRVGSHRRIAYRALVAYRKAMRARQDEALQKLADDAQELGIGF
jgi:excisionase family DNA binding protein